MNELRVGVIRAVNTAARCLIRASVFKLEKARDTLIKKQRGRRVAAGQRLVLRGFQNLGGIEFDLFESTKSYF